MRRNGAIYRDVRQQASFFRSLPPAGCSHPSILSAPGRMMRRSDAAMPWSALQGAFFRSLPPADCSRMAKGPPRGHTAPAAPISSRARHPPIQPDASPQRKPRHVPVRHCLSLPAPEAAAHPYVLSAACPGRLFAHGKGAAARAPAPNRPDIALARAFCPIFLLSAP